MGGGGGVVVCVVAVKLVKYLYSISCLVGLNKWFLLLKVGQWLF